MIATQTFSVMLRTQFLELQVEFYELLVSGTLWWHSLTFFKNVLEIQLMNLAQSRSQVH